MNAQISRCCGFVDMLPPFAWKLLRQLNTISPLVVPGAGLSTFIHNRWD